MYKCTFLSFTQRRELFPLHVDVEYQIPKMLLTHAVCKKGATSIIFLGVLSCLIDTASTESLKLLPSHDFKQILQSRMVGQ